MMEQVVKRFDLRTFVIGLAVLTLSACTNESNSVPYSPQANVFLQVDRVGRPGVKTLFENFDDHITSDRSIPSNDPVLQNAISSFITAAGQTPGTAVSKLGFDELAVDLASGGSASYLAIETNGSGFGGRGLTENVMAANLNIAYGNQFGGTVVKPCAVTDNTAASAGASSTTFPYLTAPR